MNSNDTAALDAHADLVEGGSTRLDDLPVRGEEEVRLAEALLAAEGKPRGTYTDEDFIAAVRRIDADERPKAGFAEPVGHALVDGAMRRLGYGDAPDTTADRVLGRARQILEEQGIRGVDSGPQFADALALRELPVEEADAFADRRGLARRGDPSGGDKERRLALVEKAAREGRIMPTQVTSYFVLWNADPEGAPPPGLGVIAEEPEEQRLPASGLYTDPEKRKAAGELAYTADGETYLPDAETLTLSMETEVLLRAAGYEQWGMEEYVKADELVRKVREAGDDHDGVGKRIALAARNDLARRRNTAPTPDQVLTAADWRAPILAADARERAEA